MGAQMDTEAIKVDTEEEITLGADFELKYRKLIAGVASEGDSHRVASSVIYGQAKGYNKKKTCSYYSITEEDYDKYALLFGFQERREPIMAGRKSKKDDIVNYLSGNVGRVVTPAEVADGVSISLPTFYNFYNSNSNYFKKVARGKFEIVSPETNG
jgi:hypothetical protein